jgi:hypothetical protein
MSYHFPYSVKDCWNRFNPDDHDPEQCEDCKTSAYIFKQIVMMNKLLREIEERAARHGFVIGCSRNAVGQLSYEPTDGQNFYDKLGWTESSLCE